MAAISINLLPSELTKGKAHKHVKLLNRIAIILTSIFIIVATAAAGVMFLFNNRLSATQSQIVALSRDVRSLSEVEKDFRKSKEIF